MIFRLLKFLLAAGLTTLVIWRLSTGLMVADKPVPPLGQFLNPFSGFWSNGEPLTGPHFDDVNLPGLSGPVQVLYDERLIPHIYAQNMNDAMMVQGFVTAQNRLWQMDIGSRKASGRLSEVLGERTLAADKSSRRRGMLTAAENDLLSWQKAPATLQLVESYAAGVNAWIESISQSEYPVEFKLLGYAPEKWHPLKTALISENMAEILSTDEFDLPSTNALQAFGQQTFDYLYPEWSPKQQAIVPDTGQWKNIAVLPSQYEAPARALADTTTATDEQGWLDRENVSAEGPFVGSNNWAVNGAKTKSGHPLLANDPHLRLSLPSVWYQVHIHTPEVNVYGVSLPGVPGVIIGFNDNVAWGVTNASHDVADWYQIKWLNPERTRYELDGKPREANLKIEEIKLKGKPSVFDTVRYTVWGPITHDDDPKHPLRDCAYRWLAHDVAEVAQLDFVDGMMKAKNFEDYMKAAVNFDNPAQNIIFADRQGDIAIRTQGKYPVRGFQQGRFIMDGSTWKNAWHNFIPMDQVPTMKNPSRGFVFSANQQSAPPSYPYYFLGKFEDFRSRRIFDRLAKLTTSTPDSLKAMQLDNYSYRAADATPAMLSLLDLNSLDNDGRQMVAELANWDYQYDADALAPTIFESWFDSCYVATWDEMLLRKEKGEQILMPEAWRFIELLQTDSSSIFFDHPKTPYRETARNIVTESFQKMQQYFRSNPLKKAPWGQAREVVVSHIGMMEPFSRKLQNVNGHFTAPNAQNRAFGPSWRMIVELGDQVTAQGVYPGGQSGNPGSKYYDDMLDAWATGQYFPLYFWKSPEEAADQAKYRQTFSPKH
ncbi:MAG: penicillin acylase family protein [Saprospiraceae bacterium]|nr:penicillin acylase family protein [Saprospiraceae bacterium]